MVNLDIALAETPVGLTEIEGADLAPQRTPQPHCLCDLAHAEPSVALSVQRPADEKAPFDRRVSLFVELVWLWGDVVELAGADSPAQSLGGLKHLRRSCDESRDHFLVEAPSLGRSADMSRVVCRQIGCFVADASDGPELRSDVRDALVDGQGAKQVREVEHARVALPELAPAVLDHKGAGQQQLVMGPRGESGHGPYRMSVRCHVWGGRSALMCDAHLKAVALSVGSVTLCDDWWEAMPVGLIWKEGA